MIECEYSGRAGRDSVRIEENSGDSGHGPLSIEFDEMGESVCACGCDWVGDCEFWDGDWDWVWGSNSDNSGDDVNEADEDATGDIEDDGDDGGNNNNGKGLGIGECCAAQSIMISG